MTLHDLARHIYERRSRFWHQPSRRDILDRPHIIIRRVDAADGR
jgi:hypothetical protein